MSELDGRYVKRGFWVNRAQGQVFGSTITTDQETGTILVALLAVLSSLATTQLWGLVTFVNHQLRAHGRPADAMFHQQQAILRVSPAPASFFADWMKLYWIWRKRTRHAFSRSYVPLVIAVAFAALTLSAGIFSSYVISGTNIQVLGRSSACGPLNIEPDVKNFSYAYLEGLNDYVELVDARSIPFSKECFQNETSLPVRCSAFTQPNVNLEPRRERCPFDPSVCIKNEYPAVSIDSGLVEAGGYFGWNTQPENSVKYRRKLTCGMLELDGHTAVVNASYFPHRQREMDPDEQLLVISYGNTTRGGDWANTTFAHMLLDGNVSRSFTMGYVKSFLDPTWSAVSNIDPIPQMKSNNSDLMLMSLSSNKVAFLNPVNDPFFAAHQLLNWTSGIEQSSSTLYYADSLASLLGCREQYQFCHGRKDDSDYCTDLTSLPATVNTEKFPEASDVQRAGVQLLVTSSYLYSVVLAPRVVFQARDMAVQSEGRVTSLPDDQWMREILGWEKYIWASLQTVVSDYAIGYGALTASVQPYVRTQLTPGERELCGLQKMVKPGGFVNISVFGLAFVITFSCIVTLLNLVLLKFLIYMTKFRRALSPRIERWIQDGIFHLQRQAYQGNNQGSWERIDKEIPATVTDEILDGLPLETNPPACSHVCGKVDCNGTEVQVHTITSSALTSQTEEASEGPGSEGGTSVDTRQREDRIDEGHLVDEVHEQEISTQMAPEAEATNPRELRGPGV